MADELVINQSLSFSAALDDMHWGEMVEEAVDQALLIRTMFIHGEMADAYPERAKLFY